jgi:hypothetical protein
MSTSSRSSTGLGLRLMLWILGFLVDHFAAIFLLGVVAAVAVTVYAIIWLVAWYAGPPPVAFFGG